MYKTKTTTTKQAEPKAPTLIAYQVREVSEDKKFWTRIGAAWEHGDGKGFTVQLDAIPLEGKVVLRNASESKD